MVTRKRGLFILGILLMVYLLYFLFIADSFMYAEVSPDGNYKIEIYTERSFFAMPGGGGLSSRPTKVVLKNKWGWTIGQSNDDCMVFYDDINIDWDIDNQQVFFAIGASLDLNTGECSH